MRIRIYAQFSLVRKKLYIDFTGEQIPSSKCGGAILIVVLVGFDGQNWILKNSPDFKEGSSSLITENVLRLHHLAKIVYFDF